MTPIPTTTWYRATAWLNKIEPMQVESETTARVVVFDATLTRPTSVYKNSDGQYYRPTKEEAKQALIEHHQIKVNEAQRKLEDAIAKLEAACEVEL